MEYLFVAKKGPTQKKTAQPSESGLLEQRVSPRRRVDLWVREERADGGRSKSPCIVDLSAQGAFLRGEAARINSEIDLEFVLPSRMVPVQAKGRVVRAVVTKTSPTDPAISQRDLSSGGVGVEFTEISETDRQAIEEFLRKGLHVAPTALAEAAEKTLFADTDIELFLTASLSERS